MACYCCEELANHSIWISQCELRGQELSCEKCTISDRCVQCDETVTKKKEEKKKLKCTYCPEHKKSIW